MLREGGSRMAVCSLWSDFKEFTSAEAGTLKDITVRWSVKSREEPVKGFEDQMWIFHSSDEYFSEAEAKQLFEYLSRVFPEAQHTISEYDHIPLGWPRPEPVDKGVIISLFESKDYPLQFLVEGFIKAFELAY